ncbi:MAG: hypothetical protein LBC35_06945 [Coriobacteriales bacterium]|jgi:uncharacterized protein YoxC|nr:hypothetical protein [Coriobacteriales bacterium]
MSELILQILYVIIAIFVISLIVLVFHFVSTVRKVNKTIDELGPTIDNMNKIMTDVQPILQSVQPAVQRVDPLLERVSLTVDAVNLEIMRADTILANVSDMTDTATGALDKVAGITDAPLNLLNAATDKVRDLFGSSHQKHAAEKVVRRAEQDAHQHEGQQDDETKPVGDKSTVASQGAVEQTPAPDVATLVPDIPAPSPSTAQGASPQPAVAVDIKVDYTPDFEPDDDSVLSETDAGAGTPQADVPHDTFQVDAGQAKAGQTVHTDEKSDGFYLFFTDEDGLKEGSPHSSA